MLGGHLERNFKKATLLVQLVELLDDAQGVVVFSQVYPSVCSISFPKIFAFPCCGLNLNLHRRRFHVLIKKRRNKKKNPQIHVEKLQSGGFSAICTGVKPPAASVLSHSSAIVRHSSNVAPTPPLLFQNAQHGHHIILISLLSETCQRPSLCHEEAPVPKALGRSRVFPTRSVHQSVWG